MIGGDDHHAAQVLARAAASGSRRARAAPRPRPAWCRPGLQAQRQRGDARRIEAHRVGVAHAHVDRAIGAAKDRGHRAAQRGLEIGGDVGRGPAQARGLLGVDAKPQLGRFVLEAGVEIDQAGHVADAAGDLGAQAAQRRVVLAEDLDLDAGAACRRDR